MEKRLPDYRQIISEDDDNTGVNILSLVKQPATEADCIHFSDNYLMSKFSVQKDKRMIYGPIMIPNKRLYRNDAARGEYNIYYTEEDIEIVVKKFSKNNFNNNITLEHLDKKVTGTLVENYIIRENMSIKGFEDMPVGTWMGCVYIEDEEFWNNYVKTGVVKGFSVEIYGVVKRETFSKQDTIENRVESILQLEASIEDIQSKLYEMFKDEYKK